MCWPTAGCWSTVTTDGGRWSQASGSGGAWPRRKDRWRTRCPTWSCEAVAAAPAPLEAHDPDRARALKAKIRDRVSDVRRHLVALRTAMAEFGEDFDLDSFQHAYDSEDPVELNHVKAVERGVDQLYNYIAELAAFGLELAGIRT